MKLNGLTRLLTQGTRCLRYVAAFAVLSVLAPVMPGQSVTTHVATGSVPNWIGINPVTNKMYVANQNSANVTVIDGQTNSTTTVTVGNTPDSVAVNPLTNKIYVANGGSNSVTIIDGVTNSTATVAAGAKPFSLAVNPVTNQIYVANVNGNNLTVIDGATNHTTTVATGTAPYSVAVNPVTNKVYVTNLNSNNLTVINGATNSTATVTTGQGPYSVALNPVTNKIYVANAGGNSVTIIDGNNNNSTATVGVGSYPISVTVNPITNKIYVSNDLGNTVTVIDGASNGVTTLAVGSFPVSVAVNPITNKIYVADDGGGETVIDGATNAVTELAAAGTYPNLVAVNPVTNKVYVSNYGSDNVTVIDGASDMTASFSVGTDPLAVAVNPVTNKIYVVNAGSGSVSIIDLITNAVLTMTTGNHPLGVAVNSATNQIYVANAGDGTVSVIDGATNDIVNVPAGPGAAQIAVNPTTNKIYVSNSSSSTVTVIDGASNSTATVTVGPYPYWLVANPVTNKIYVLNQNNSVTVIDGASNSTTTVATGSFPSDLALNTETNKIYVTNMNFGSPGSVTVIDGFTNSTTAVTTGMQPAGVAVNPVTNKIYVANTGSNSITLIDGASNNTATIPLASGTEPEWIAVNPVTNKIYINNHPGGNVNVLDGATNSITTVATGPEPVGMAVNTVTNQTYVTDQQNNIVTVISEQQVQAIPLTTTITPLANNQTSDSNPGFTVSAASSFTPNATTPNAVYYQVDTWQGTWSTATGGNPSFVANVSSLQPGSHILYAFAGDGQQATSTQAGAPLTGAIAAYSFVVTGSGILQTQTVRFVNLPSEGGTGTSITLSATASTPVTFSSSPASVCSVSGTTLTFNGTGLCSVTATAAGSDVYQPASTSQNINVLFGQTITFAAISSQNVNTTLALKATASSGLSVSFTSSTAGVCTISGTTASFLTPGTCTIKATQTGNGSYAPATPVVRSFSVTSESGLGFIPVTPCRVVDTRDSTSSLGGPTMRAGSTRTFPLPMGSCALPATASAYSLNVTVVPHTTLAYLSLWPSGQTRPVVSTLNSLDGRIVANAAIVPAGTNGAVNVYVTDQTDVIVDVDGYFGAAGSSGALTFVPVTPCRVEDTRNANGPFGGPILAAGSSRSFAIPSSGCGIPATAAAYSVNATVVPTSTLDYLTLFPTGSSRPYVSTLNSLNGQIVANAAIVPAGNSGAVTAYVTDQTQLITDINGYFTSNPPTPLVFNTVTPCRVADTRNANGSFGGPIMAANSTRSFLIPESACGIPSTAKAYALNVTAVPPAALTYLTLWPAGETRPTVSTLNSGNGQVVANAALVPAGTQGAVEVFVTDQTHVIIDIVGYFSAP